MRAEYDFSRARRITSRRGRWAPTPEDEEPLTKGQLRELQRRYADLKDPVRYLILSRFGPRFELFYNISDDVYVMNDPTHATLFKRRKAAAAIRKQLGPGLGIVKCTTRMQKGVRVPLLKKGSRGRPKPQGAA